LGDVGVDVDVVLEDGSCPGDVALFVEADEVGGVVGADSDAAGELGVWWFKLGGSGMGYGYIQRDRGSKYAA